MSKPDWDFWLCQKTVELWEAAYLICGLDPDDDSYRDISSFGISDEKVAKRARTLMNHFGSMKLEKPLSDFVNLGLSMGWAMPPELKILAATTTETDTSTITKWPAARRAELLKEHNALKAGGHKSPTRELENKYDLSGTFIRKLLKRAKSESKN